jgi:hypothetical protein
MFEERPEFRRQAAERAGKLWFDILSFLTHRYYRPTPANGQRISCNKGAANG